MKTFRCTCDSTLFFENDHCLACGKEVGFCPLCDDLGPLTFPAQGVRCEKGGHALLKCENYLQYQVCNRCVELGGAALCDYCQLTATVPDLSVEGNRRRWYDLEVAKRRLLYTLERLGLPIFTTDPRLVFDFKGDVEVKDALWRTVGTAQRVFTGHANGRITINIREADDEVREKLRVDLQESHRTLVGHFHHEVGHFYWDLLVRDHADWRARFVELFGDHTNPSYGEALERYYQQGPKPGWGANYVSAYATMHPWEDFAETFASYLDMVAVVDTAHHLPGPQVELDVAHCDMRTMLDEYTRIGVLLNEMNRTLGLIDFLPHLFVPAVVSKLQLVHDLLRAHASPPPKVT